MKRILAILCCISMLCSTALSCMVVRAESADSLYDLTVNQAFEPSGVETPITFGWKMNSHRVGAAQKAYALELATDAEFETVVWSTEAESGSSNAIPYTGNALESGTDYWWRIRVTNDLNETLEASSRFLTGLLSAEAHAGAAFIKNGETVADADLEYTVELDLYGGSRRTALVFNAIDAKNHYMWQLDFTDGATVNLKPHTCIDGAYTALSDYLVDVTEAVGGIDGLRKGAHLKIDATAEAVVTYLNGKKVSEIPVSAFGSLLPALGTVGYRIHGTEYGYYDNLTVKRGDELLLSYDFNAYNPFEDGTVEGGKFLPSGTAGVFLVRHADVFRTVFTPEKEIADAKLFMSALGNYDAWINGVRVGDQELKAGYSDPNTRQYYNTYDVTDKIENGANALSAVVTSGWWNGKVVSHAQNSGKAMAFRAILKITYADGTTENLVTDTENWKTFTFAPVLMGDIFNGETYDARISDGWKYADYDTAGWLKPVVSTDFSGTFSSSLGIDAYARKDLERSVKSGYVYEGVTEKATSQYGVVKKISTFGDEAFTLEAGQTAIIDLGQNAAGWEDLTLSGKAGTTVRIRHAEVLNEGKGATSRGNDGPEGSAYVSNLRTSAATTHYILSGAEQETYHPAFTFYGFRYLELTATDTITVYKVRGTVVTSALEDTGLLTTADADVNQLISNSKWGMYSNYLSVPTDCPQRDERAGWTADTQVFAVAGSYLNNSREFLRTFLQSMHDTQRADGAYRSVSPTGNYGASFGALGWADAGVIIPYELWKQYGDLEIVREMYESMQLYVDGYLASTEKKGGAQNYGDHLAYEANDTEIKSMLGVSYYAYDARMMSEMAAALGKTEDAIRYQELYQTEKNYFIEQYVNEDGTLIRGEQSVCLYALYLDLLPDEASFAAVKKQLVDNISSHGNKLQTGFLGTKIILDVLTEIGETELAYKVLLQHDNPSWLYTVDQGATTMWENWNAYSIDSGFVSVGSGSFNHYAYGAVVGWMYRYMAGITPGSDGYKSFTLQPRADRSLGAAEATYDSVYGTIKSAWSYKDDAFNYSCTVPANTNATIMVPVTNMETLIGGDAEGLTFVEHKDGYAVYTAVAGSYVFSTESKEENSVSVTVSNSDESILSYLLYDGNKYGWDTPIEVEEGTEITLKATAYNNVDYQMEWYDSNGKKLGLNTLTITPNEDTAYVVKPVYVAKINLALNAAITASSTVNSSWPASTLTDGTLIHTSGSSRGWSSTKGTRGQTTFSSPITLTIDLGTETTFNQWKLYPRTYGFNANTGVYCFPEDYTVEISGDNSTWTTVKTVTDGATPDNIYQPAVDMLDTAVSGRYVRFSFSGINRGDDYGDCLIQLSEVAICHAVASEGTVEINLSNSDANVPAKVTYNDTEYVLPATLTVPKDEEVTLVAQMLNDVDYQAYFTDGTTTTDANTLTVTLQENANYSVSGKMISGKNLAEGAAVSGEEANTTSWRIANLVDGTLVHTVSSARGWSSKGAKNVLEFSDAPKTVTLTMKNAVTFDQWKLYPRNYLISGIYCFPIAYTVEISTDNATWTKVADVTNGAVPENIYQPIVVDLNEAVTAQYVR
ncbi:MAG: family 78 glycoside hydrolase catalytic domain, partial [Clostridia bacterium]|nr:family 78 glycoside hydrolase catalytic domain [Clostridia bacterium]